LREASYVFWSQRGPFRWINPNWVREGEVLEVRRSGASLLKPWENVQGLRRGVVAVAAVVGSMLGAMDMSWFLDSKPGPALAVAVMLGEVFLGALALTAEEHVFWRYVAEHSPRPGLEVQIERAELGWYLHRLLVKAQGGEFMLTVFGLKGRLRRALGPLPR
jgi:hypothetical protein